MYLATEGLYAEIMSSKNGIAERLQTEGIMVAGPSTITALLNSLAMGFRSIAINEKANKVDEAGKVLDEADHRNDIIQKRLRTVESLESTEASSILEIE